MNKHAANLKLSKYSKYITVVHYTSSKGRSVFKDSRDGDVFSYSFTNVISACKKDPEYKYGKITRSEEEYRKKLAKYAPELELIEYSTLTASKFYDTKRKLVFEYSATKLLHKKKTKKNFIPRPTKQEKSGLAKKARKAQGGIHSFSSGISIPELAKEIGRSRHNVWELVKNGYTEEQLRSLQDNNTSIEVIMKDILESFDITYIFNRKLNGTSCRPDYYLINEDIVVECDGLYYHSDLFKEKLYHKKRYEEYVNVGIRPFFFRQDELLLKPNICSSIIQNALNKNTTRIFARKCEINSISPSFFSDNHLMGKGKGKCFGLYYNSNPVAGIQVGYINGDNLDISRFCVLPGTVVVGGFSKLLSYIESTYCPVSIRTFIDLRYGTGRYLASLGFKKKSQHLSFRWTNGTVTYHRLKFPGNSGYNNGLYKIWDCGQASWVKVLR